MEERQAASVEILKAKQREALVNEAFAAALKMGLPPKDLSQEVDHVERTSIEYEDIPINKLVLDSLARIEVKSDRLGERMDNLVDTTNHRLDDFRVAMDIHARGVNETVRTVLDKLSTKADKDELLTSYGEHLMQNSVVRWVVGSVFVGVIGTVTLQEWWGTFFHWVARVAGG